MLTNLNVGVHILIASTTQNQCVINIKFNKNVEFASCT